MIELSLGKWGQICHITWYPAVGKMGNRGGAGIDAALSQNPS